MSINSRNRPHFISCYQTNYSSKFENTALYKVRFNCYKRFNWKYAM